ncbi:hypothetical protein B9Z55_021561 [Caenorhabditis nigoni]|uniref:G-protein coupled receptors family 1 profile domain-containing protein n=1 Tax=Caenorhabditis nigoni TaxID=1611254 RepID=A0A2G5TSH0_9PELO|nr:hypothetical protein B9Z55_021561 [Caenorhabditis nigoni]
MSLESFVSQICSYLVNFLGQYIPYFSVISISVNLCHVFILSRKSVTSSSMNTLLIGIALVDILSPILYVKRGVERVWNGFLDPCAIPTYNEVLLDLILAAFCENFRRCSTWMGLLLAITRTVSVKLATGRSSKRLGDSKFGLFLIFATVTLSAPIMIPYCIRYQIVESAPQSCQFLNGDSKWITKFSREEFSPANKKIVLGGAARTIHILLTGIFGQLIPSILFPIFASILICELRKPEKMNSTTVKTEKISKMVIYMTITFLVIEFPIGVGKIFNSMQTESYSTWTTRLEEHMYIFAIFAIFINFGHIFVLSQKMMTSSAVTSLLIGIAVVDCLSPIFYVKIGIRDLIFNGPWEVFFEN